MTDANNFDAEGRRLVEGHPTLVYAHDPIRVDAVAREFATHFEKLANDPFSKVREAAPKGTTIAENWLGIIRGCQIVQAKALKNFTELGEPALLEDGTRAIF